MRNTGQTVKKDVSIEGTTFHVTSVYGGTKSFDKALYDWAIAKTLATAREGKKDYSIGGSNS